MPFLIYQRHGLGHGASTFINPKRTTHLPAVMKDYVQEEADGSAKYTWHLDEATLLGLLGKEADNRALIVDLKPGQEKAVSLYRVRNFWGFSYKNWTPLLVRMKALFVDKPAEDPAEFKEKFTDSEACHDQVHEFLYVRFGTVEGIATWGRSGWVNATLLWSDALRHFIAIVDRNLKNSKDLT